MVDRLAAMELFVRVVEGGSFSAAARALASSQSYVSKSVASLEARLGVRLVIRTTRRMSLTPAGTNFYQHCKEVIARIEEAERAASLGQHAITGRLRVNTSAMLALPLVQPALLAFRALHPAIDIVLVMDDRRIDPVEEDVDIVVRVGPLANSGLMVRRAGASPFGFYASPGYLAGRPAPERLEDHAAHQIIVVMSRRQGPTPPSDEGAADWPQPKWQVPITVSSVLLAHGAAEAGAGIAALPKFLADTGVAAGRLVQVLTGERLPPAQISLLHPYGQSPPRRIASFIDFAITRWREAGLVI